MKKTFIIVSMLMVAALVLSACAGGANNQNNTPVPGAEFDATPVDGVVVETPVVEEPVVETPVVELEPTLTPDMVTPDVDATPVDGVVVDETPVAGVPVTGDDDCNPYRLQGLLDMDVVDGSGEQFGDVDAVIVMRDLNASAPMTTDAGNAAVTTTAVAPRIAYVVIDLENNDDELLVPFSAFDMTVFDRDVAGTTDGTVNDAANEFDTCALTFNTSFTADSLANAPVWDDDLDLNIEGWDEQYRTFWSEQGVTFNEADFANLGNPLRLGDSFNNIDARNPNNDDLGEVEDFIVNPQTGAFDYAVLATGGFLGIGERYIPVPMNMVNWVVEEVDDMDETGYIVINIADDEWENAPSFDGLDEFDTTVEGWDTDLQSFWNNLRGTTE